MAFGVLIVPYWARRKQRHNRHALVDEQVSPNGRWYRALYNKPMQQTALSFSKGRPSHLCAGINPRTV